METVSENPNDINSATNTVRLVVAGDINIVEAGINKFGDNGGEWQITYNGWKGTLTEKSICYGKWTDTSGNVLIINGVARQQELVPIPRATRAALARLITGHSNYVAATETQEAGMHILQAAHDYVNDSPNHWQTLMDIIGDPDACHMIVNLYKNGETDPDAIIEALTTYYR